MSVVAVMFVVLFGALSFSKTDKVESRAHNQTLYGLEKPWRGK